MKDRKNEATKTLKKLIALSEAINSKSAIEANEIGLMVKMFIIATLPHSDPGNVDKFFKHNGSLSMTIQAGCTPYRNFGIPYGSLPRLILIWIATQVKKTNSRKLQLGDSFNDFLRQLDLIPSGGKLGNKTAVKKQMEKLLNAIYTLRVCDENHTGSWITMQLTDAGRIWDSNEDFVIISEKFYKAVQNSIPVDMRAIRALKKSPLALDIYIWVTYRMSYLKQPTTISWQQLMDQFGQNYSSKKEFKKSAQQAINKIKIVYPEMNIFYLRGRLKLLPSPPHVPMIEDNPLSYRCSPPSLR